MTREFLVIVQQPACANVLLYDGRRWKRLLQDTRQVCEAFIAGYRSACGDNAPELMSPHACGAGDCMAQPWQRERDGGVGFIGEVKGAL